MHIKAGRGTGAGQQGVIQFITAANSDNHGNGNAPSESLRMVIKSNGNVGIGFSEHATAYRLHVNGVIANADGDILATAFDARDAENVRAFEGGLGEINDLKVQEFESHGKTRVGMLAQELKEVIPSAVSGDENEMKEYEVGPALGKVVVPKTKLLKLVEDATEEELATLPLLHSKGNQYVVIHDCEEDEHMFAEDISHADFVDAEFHDDAEWEKTSDAVMDEKFVPMGVAHSELIPMLVKGMQELSAKNDELSKKVDELSK